MGQVELGVDEKQQSLLPVNTSEHPSALQTTELDPKAADPLRSAVTPQLLAFSIFPSPLLLTEISQDSFSPPALYLCSFWWSQMAFSLFHTAAFVPQNKICEK